MAGFSIGGGFGKDKSKTKTSNNVTLDPWSQNRIEDYSKRIESMIPQAQAYGGPLNVGPNAWQTQAGQMAGSLWDYKPGQVSAQKFTDADLSGYMDKGLEGNIQRTLGGIERGRQVQQVADNQSATAAKAFGGSRHGVADSLTNAEFGRIAADTEGSMRSAAFDKAASLWGADRAAQMGADQFNVQMGLQGRQLGLAGAGLMADLGGQLNQLDAGNIARNYAEFARLQGVPYQNIGVLQQLLGMTPVGWDGQGTSKTTGTNFNISAGYGTQ